MITMPSTSNSCSRPRRATCAIPSYATYVTTSEGKQAWCVQQMLVDPEGHNDWVEFVVDLPASRAAAEPVLRLARLGPLT